MSMYSNGIITRERIVEAGKRLFYAAGYRATTYKQICEAAGINPGTLKHHFGGKPGLAAFLVREMNTQKAQIVEARYPDEPRLAHVMVETILYLRLAFDDAPFRRFFTECVMDDVGAAEGHSAVPLDNADTSDAVEKAVGADAARVIMPVVYGMDRAFEELVHDEAETLDADQSIGLYLSMAYAPVAQMTELLPHAKELADGVRLGFTPDFDVVEL